MLISLLIGALLGTLAGLGIGGGSLLVLWLTTAQNTAPMTARGINLMFFIASAGALSIIRCRKGVLDKKAVIPAAVSGCIAALACSLLSKHLDAQILKTILGILFLVTGLKELFYRPTKAR